MVGRKVGAFVVLAVLACARPADAGWLDFIWEMTGPRMYGLGFECEVSIARNPDRGCVVPLLKIFQDIQAREANEHPWFWVSTEAFYYYYKQGEKDYGGGVGGFGVDPMILFSRIKGEGTNRGADKDIRITSGAGLTLQRFWGDDFEAFGNSGFKFRPLAVDFPLGERRVNIAYNLRYFWDGFEAAPAVAGTPTTQRIPAVFRKADQSETVHGIVISFTF